MDDQHHMPNMDGLIPPLDPNMTLSGSNLAQLVLMAIEAVALGMEPREAARITGLQLFEIFYERAGQFNLTMLTVPAWLGEGGQN